MNINGFVSILICGLILCVTPIGYAQENEITERDSISLKEFDCVINPSKVADIGSIVPGVIKAVEVDRSDFVNKGEVIALFDAGLERSLVDLMSKRASLTSEIESSRVQVALSQRQYERAQEAFQAKALSFHDLDMAQSELKFAKYKLRQAQDKRLLALKELAKAKVELERRTIVAPFSGVVMEKFKTEGEYVEAEPIVRLAQLNPLYVEVIVNAKYLGQIKKGMQARVQQNDFPESQLTATVSIVDYVMDAASGTFGVRLTLANPERKIPAGLRCNLKFIDA